MAQVKNGDQVTVHYTGRLDDGTVFDSSEVHGPLAFRVGDGQVITGFENAVTGMTPGEKRTVKIPATEAYGPKREELMVEVDRERLPQDIEPAVGKTLEIRQPDGQVIVVRIVDVTDQKVCLDANHPLAGQDLTFDIELLEIA